MQRRRFRRAPGHEEEGEQAAEQGGPTAVRPGSARGNAGVPSVREPVRHLRELRRPLRVRRAKVQLRGV